MNAKQNQPIVQKRSKYFSHERDEETAAPSKRVEVASKNDFRSARQNSISNISTVNITSKRDDRMTILLHPRMKIPYLEKELAKHFKIVRPNNTDSADIIISKLATAFLIVDCRVIENSFDFDRKIEQSIEFSNQFKIAYTLLLVDSQSQSKASQLQYLSVGRMALKSTQPPIEQLKAPVFFIFHSEEQLLEFILKSAGIERVDVIDEEMFEKTIEKMTKKVDVILPYFKQTENVIPSILVQMIPSIEPYQAQVLFDTFRSLENIIKAPSAQYIHERTPFDLPTAQNIKQVLDKIIK